MALLAAWLLLFLTKTGAVEWLQVHGNALVHSLASCWFCLSWWACVVIAAAVAAAEWIVLGSVPPSMVIVPFLSTPITRKLL